MASKNLKTVICDSHPLYGLGHPCYRRLKWICSVNDKRNSIWIEIRTAEQYETEYLSTDSYLPMQKLIIENQLTSYTQDNEEKLPLYAGWFITLDLKETNNLKVVCIAEHLCQNAEH